MYNCMSRCENVSPPEAGKGERSAFFAVFFHLFFLGCLTVDTKSTCGWLNMAGLRCMWIMQPKKVAAVDFVTVARSRLISMWSQSQGKARH